MRDAQDLAFDHFSGNMSSMKVAPILLFMAALLALAPQTAQAQDNLPPQQSFPILTPDPPKPKTQSFSISFMDQGISSISRSIMMRLNYRQLFATNESRSDGYVLSAHFHHLFGTHPYLMSSGITNTAGIYPNYNELGVGFGYRWAFENFAVIPQAHFRDQFAFGTNANHHLIGFEPGVRLEYWIYPEVARLSVDYGFNVPFVHLANTQSNISPFTLSLHRVYTELSYRLVENFDILAGFYWWQVPSQLGSGGITDATISNVTGFQIGAGLTF